MTINLHLPNKSEMLRPTITVIGVGGAGGNAVNNMIASNLEGVNFVVANTDAQALDHSLTDRIIQLGAGLTKGLGAGANPEVGRAAAEEARDEISAYIDGSNMVFITAGMGGGTGTGAASVVARLAKEQGILTVAVVTKPFQFEGTHRMKMAEEGLKELQQYVDTLIMIPNQNLFRVANEKTTFADAFRMADEVLHSGVRGVTDLMVKPGLINLDFADIRTVMREMGKAMMGTGEATGERRAIEAAEAAISNPLLDDVSLKGARALLINITGGGDMTLFEVDEAANRIREEVDSEANIIFGSTFNDAMEGKMRVSVVATGIDAVSASANIPTRATAAANPVSSSSTEVKRPFSVGVVSAAVRADARPVQQRTTHEPARTQVQQPSREQEAPAAVRTELPAARALPPVRQEKQEEEFVPRIRFQERQQEAAPASRQQERSPAREVAYAQESKEDFSDRYEEHSSDYDQPEQEQREEMSARKFLKKVADVGRALSVRSEPRPEASERVHVVQKPVAEEKPPQPGDDQYLDIPAFLRRQAN